MPVTQFSEREALEPPTLIEATPCSACFLCGERGKSLYVGLADWLFGAPGEWGMRHCEPCGLAWLDPQPMAKDIAKLYTHYYTHKPMPMTRLARLRHAILQCMLEELGYPARCPKRILPRLLFNIRSVARTAALEVCALPASDVGELLDVGCGNGEFIARMRSLGWGVSGVDPDPRAASHARSRGLQVFNGMISDVPRTACYDVITLSHVIEHVVDPVELLRECQKRLRPGTGRLIITTPNLASLGHWWFRDYWRGLEVPRHLNVFSPAALRECIGRAGLIVQSLRTETRLAHMIYVPSACAKAGGRDVGERSDFKVSIKVAAYMFRVLEDLIMFLRDQLGEEVFCVCTASAAT